MFTDHQLKWKSIIYVGTFVISLLWFIVLVASGIKASDLFPHIIRLGIVAFLVVVIWAVFIKFLWKCNWIKIGGWLVDTPNLNGRWKGKYVSSFDNKEREMVLEIRQTLLRISCTAYGEDNVVQGYSARLLSDHDNITFKLSYLYHAKRKVSTSVAGDEHEGVTILTLIEDSPNILRGFYVNDRDPSPRKADVELAFESNIIKGKFS